MPKHNLPSDFFVCPDCSKVSFDPADIKEGFCKNCDDWTGNSSEPVYITEREEC
jgi:transcription initiation factor IIE alpha subunit